MKNKYFQYYQPNEKDVKDKYGDCVIRALTKALNKNWIQVFDLLVPIAREHQMLLNGQSTYTLLLEQQGFVYYGISNRKGAKRPTVESFTKDHKTGIYYLNLANHCVTVKDGKYYDTWDCGHKCLYGYWTKEVV